MTTRPTPAPVIRWRPARARPRLAGTPRAGSAPARRHLAWLVAGAATAFLVPFVLADGIGLRRDVYYGIYMAAVAGLFAAWARDTGQPVRAMLARRPRAAVGLGLLCAGVLALIVVRADEATTHPTGVAFVAALGWRGVLYGAADGLLLSAFPILLVFAATRGGRLRRGRGGLAAVVLLAMLASLAMTAAYHAGYRDFRSAKLRKPLTGDLIWSVPTLVTLNPLGAVVAHAGLHVAAVAHSYDTDVYLPPHAARPVRPDAFAVGRRRVLARLVAEPGVAPGASAAVIAHGRSWTGAAGIADRSTGRRVVAADHFRIASLTKTYTAAVVLKLVADGRVRLSDTVGHLLPGLLPADKRAITVRQLLSHSSGLYDSLNAGVAALITDRRAFLKTIESPALRARIIRVARRHDTTINVPSGLWVAIAAAEPLDFAPGTSHEYSNTNYILLGWIAERVAGEPFGRLLRERILAPLGLRQTAYDPRPAMPRPYAHGYTLPDGPNHVFYPGRGPVDTSGVSFGSAAGGAIVATAADTARFYAALLRGQVVPPRVLRRVMLPLDMGIGPSTTRCTPAYGHTGALFGYASFVAVSPRGDRVAVLLVNGRGPGTDVAGPAALVDLLCGPR